MRHTHALVRRPCARFAQGQTQSREGPPDLALALTQHAAYRHALADLGLQVTELPDAPDFPDGTFVEDTALCFPGFAVLTRPGAPSRMGETASVEPALRRHFPRLLRIEPPGTLDGGDVCVAEDLVLIGHSARTNEEGAAQLANIVREAGFKPHIIDIRGSRTLLHLKSGITYLGENLFLLCEDAPPVPALARFERLTVNAAESYAANALALNGQVLLAEGYPRLAADLRERGRQLRILQVSEFRKMDGGLTCLSLRF